MCVQLRARPGGVSPTSAELRRGLAATGGVRAGRDASVGRVPPAEPFRVGIWNSERDGEIAVVGASRLRRAPEGSRRGIGVLVELAGALMLIEHRAGGPGPAHDLPRDRAGDVGGAVDVIVCVTLDECALGPDSEDMARDPQVGSGEGREAVRRALVCRSERVPEVLRREVLAGFRCVEELYSGGERHETGSGEIGDLGALAQEILVA